MSSYLNKHQAFVFSLGQIGLGMYLSIKGRNSAKWTGGILISAGLSSGLYAFQTDQDQRKYDDKEYARRVGYGILSGILSGGFAKFSQNVGRVARISVQVFGSSASSAVITSIATAVTGQRIDLRLMGRKALICGIGGGAGALSEVLTASILNTEMTNNLLNQSIAFVSDEVARNVLFHTLRRMIESGLSSGNSKLIMNVCENIEEKDPEKKKKIRAIIVESFQSALLGAAISGTLCALEQRERIQQYNRAKRQLEESQENLLKAQQQKSKSEDALGDLRKKLEHSGKTLAEKQDVLKRKESELNQKKQDKESVQARIENAQAALAELKPSVEKATKSIPQSEQDLVNEQREIKKWEQALKEAEQNDRNANAQLVSAKQTASTAQQTFDKEVGHINKDICHYLKHKYKAKVHGREIHGEEEIRKAYLEGQKIQWKKHRHKTTVHLKPSVSLAEQQKTQKIVEATATKIQNLQSQIATSKVELEIAQFNAQYIQDEIDFNKGQIHRYQDVQKDLKTAVESSSALEKDLSKGQTEVATEKTVVQGLEKQLGLYQTEMQAEQAKLRELLSKVSGLASLTQEQLLSVDTVFHQQPVAVSVDMGTLSKALQIEAVSYVDCSLGQLIPHIVLVHALNHHNPPDRYVAEMADKDENEKILFWMQKVLTSDGVIGQHLQLNQKEFEDNFVDRPHLHWSWNQLVQPNGGIKRDGTPVNSWENAQIALLEPLSTFEERVYYRPFGVTPFDTFTFQSHRFSKKSILLVPEVLADAAKAYLKDFRGTVVPFRGTLRSAIVDSMQMHYPETWHICDDAGNLTGKRVDYSAGGYSPRSCIKTTDGKVIVLINNHSDAHSRAFKEYQRGRRFIGLHVNSLTFLIEDERNAYFQTLKRFKENHSIVKDNPLFAGEVRDLRQLGALNAYNFYQRALQYDVKTGILDVAKYLMTQAIFADLISLAYKKNPKSRRDLSAVELTLIFEANYVYLFTLLDDISTHLASPAPEKQQRVPDLFRMYCAFLEQSLADTHRAKEEALRLTGPDKIAPWDKKPLCLLVGQEEWDKIELPRESIEFDLGKSWPLSDALSNYVNKVSRALPKDIQELRNLFQQLFANPAADRKELHRFNIIAGIIQWAIQEQFYLGLRRDNSVGSILANKLSGRKDALAEYGLEAEDFTKAIGDSLFDNISAQIKNRPSEQLRQDVVRHMQTYSDRFKPAGQDVETWQKYLAALSQSQVWGTELEIRALADILDYPIVLIKPDQQPKIYNPGSGRVPLFLHNVFGNHFEACVPFKGLTGRDIFIAIQRQK